MPRVAQRGLVLPWFVDWKDEQDRFYVRDETEFPVIRVMKLALDPVTG